LNILSTAMNWNLQQFVQISLKFGSSVLIVQKYMKEKC